MYCDVVVGIDTEGRYVAVRWNGVEPVVCHLSVEQLGSVARVVFKDSIVDVKCPCHTSSRIIRSVLLSFEDDLVLIDSIEILNWGKLGLDGLSVNVEVVSMCFTYGEFLVDRQRTCSFDTMKIGLLMNAL